MSEQELNQKGVGVKYEYELIDLHTQKVCAIYDRREVARRRMEAKNKEFGAIRYTTREKRSFVEIR